MRKGSGRRRSLLLLAAAIGGLLPAVASVAHPKPVLASSAYETAVLADSPSAYYRLGESGGSTASDDSGNGVNLTYPGSGVTLGTTGALAGDSDTAVTFSGSAVNGINGPDTGFPSGASARTIELWFETSVASPDPTLIDYGDQTAPSYHSFAIWLNGSSEICVNADSYMHCQTALYPLNDGHWHQLDVAYDGSLTYTYYIDGQPDGTATLSTALGTVLATNSTYLGGDGASGDELTGKLDEVAIYPSDLTYAQVDSHWTAATGITCPSSPSDAYGASVMADSPSRYYRLDESSGLGVADYSGNCATGTYAGAGVTYGVTGALVSNSDTAVTFSGTPIFPVTASDGSLPSGHDARTIETWVKTSTAGPSLVHYGTPTGGNALWIDTSTTLCYNASGYMRCATAPYSITDGYWHDLAVTYDGNVGLNFYVDGGPIGSQTLGGQLSTTLTGTGLIIGGDSYSGDQLTGSQAETAIYSSDLSLARIKAHYLASGNRIKPTVPPTPANRRAGGLNATETCSGAGSGLSHRGGADPVDTETGAFSETFTDVSITGRSCPLQITRTYNSDAASTNGPFGYGWTYNYGMSLAVSGSSPNQVATITQENGSQVTFDQPASGSTWPPAAPQFIATLTYNSGSSTWTFVRQAKDTYTFNSSGQLTQAEDLNGYTTSFSYTSGDLTTITDPASRTLTLGWTGSNITSVTDSNVSGNTRTVSYSYDGSGNLEDVTDVNGGDTHFAYDGSHRMTTMKDPVCEALGGSCPGVQNHYDGSGRVDWQKDQLNRETTFAYSGTPDTASGGTTIVTDPSSNETLDGYQWGLLTFETRGYASADAATTYYQYDPSTLALTGVLDPNGNLTTYTVDSSGNILTTTDPLSRTTTKTYNALNEVLTTEDGNGVTTTYTYDANGNLLTVSTPLSGTSATATNCKSPSTAVAMAQVTCYTYGNGTYPGDVTQSTDPDGKVTYYHYDGNGYLDEVKDPLGNVTGTVRNNDGWVTATYTPKAGCTWNSSPPTGCSSTYETQYSYVVPGSSPAVTNEFGLVRTVTDPLSHTTKSTYDADGNTLSTTDGDGNTTSYTYDLANELTTTTRPDSTTQVTDYNPDGTVEDQKDGKGNTLLAYGYDALALVITVTDALSNVTTYTHDADGNRLTQQDPGGNCATPTKCTTMTYDADNELQTVTYSDGVTPNVTSVTYDSDGQRTGMTDGTGTSSWTYDQLRRLTSYTNGNGATVTYGYASDLKDQVATIAYPNSVGTVTQTWNDDGTLASVEDWNSKTTTFGYDANANLHTITDPSTTNVVDTFGYNAADAMTSVSDSNGSVLFSANYTRDGNGQLASDDSVSSSVGSYRYNSLNQLCYGGSASTNACSSPPASSNAYAFDDAGNLTTNNGNSQQFNGADELCWSLPSGTSANACGSVPTGATTYGYDTRGNLTSAVPSSGSATCDAYDQASRLTSIKTGTGSSCSSPTTVGTYAYDGDGLRESKTVSGTTTQFAWDGMDGNLLQQNAAGTKTSYIYGPGGLPVEQISSSTTTYLHHDQIGSTRLITDSAGATGTATTLTYDPYGNDVSTSGSLTTNLQFQGQYLDAESGLYYLRARYDDPATAQFLSLDPAVASTMSPYAYVSGDPLGATDPSGEVAAAAACALVEIPVLGDIACGAGLVITVVGTVIVVTSISSDGQANAATATAPAAPPEQSCQALTQAQAIAAANASAVAADSAWMFAKKQPYTLSPQEQAALEAAANGQPANPKDLASAKQKLKANEKYSGDRRNSQK